MNLKGGFRAASYPQNGLSPQALIALAWIDASTTWDLPRLHSHVTSYASDFKYEYRPRTMHMPTKTLEDWKAYTRRMKQMLPDFWVEVLSIHEATACEEPKDFHGSTSPSAVVVVAHGIAHATSRTGAKFEQETILFIHIRPESEPVIPHLCELSPPAASTTAADSYNALPHAPSCPPPRSTNLNLKIYRIVEFLDTVSIKSFFAEECQRARKRQLPTPSSPSPSMFPRPRTPSSSLHANSSADAADRVGRMRKEEADHHVRIYRARL